VSFLIIIGAILVYAYFWHLHDQDVKMDMLVEKGFSKQENIIINRYETDGDIRVINNIPVMEEKLT